MSTVTLAHLGGDRFALDVRGHTIEVDQPLADGGEDKAPTPTELFVAGLVACVAHYARRYLARHGIDDTGLAVEAAFDLAARPARVGRVRIRLVRRPRCRTNGAPGCSPSRRTARCTTRSCSRPPSRSATSRFPTAGERQAVTVQLSIGICSDPLAPPAHSMSRSAST